MTRCRRRVRFATAVLFFLLLPWQVSLAGDRGWTAGGQFNWYTPGKFGQIGSPVAHDLDGDGLMEVILLIGRYDPGGNAGVEVVLFDSNGVPLGNNWPVLISGAELFGNVAVSAPMAANLDISDQELEIIVPFFDPQTSRYAIHALNHDGTFFWSTPFERTITHPGLQSSVDLSPNAIGDIDGNGIPEIVAAVGDQVFVIEPDKSILFEADLNNDTYCISSAPALADLDRDGRHEVIVNFDRYYAWRSDGTPLPGWPIDIPGTMPTPSYCISPAVGDLDGDGDLEVVFADIWAHPFQYKKWIYAYHHDGTVVTGWPVEDIGVGGANRFNSPALADIDGDGKLEVISLKAGADSEVCIYHHDGAMASGWPQQVNLTGITSLYYIANAYTPSVGDLDGDKEAEIMVVAMDRNDNTVPAIYLFNADGSDVAGFPLPTESGAMLGAIPSMVDLDGDMRAGVLYSYYRITGGMSGIVTWYVEVKDDAGWQAFDPWRMPWPMYQRDQRHTGSVPPDFSHSPRLDVKCNGMDHGAIASSADNITLTIDVESRDHAGLGVDLWVVVRRTSAAGFWSYGYHGVAGWMAGLGNVYFTGGLVDLFDTALDQPVPVGTYVAYLGYDLLPNGSLDLPALGDYDLVDFEVVP